jgi:hypothetical protein
MLGADKRCTLHARYGEALLRDAYAIDPRVLSSGRWGAPPDSPPAS